MFKARQTCFIIMFLVVLPATWSAWNLQLSPAATYSDTFASFLFKQFRLLQLFYFNTSALPLRLHVEIFSLEYDHLSTSIIFRTTPWLKYYCMVIKTSLMTSTKLFLSLLSNLLTKPVGLIRLCTKQPASSFA